jgi:predicted ATPase/type II secretory pathway predicted ATPase ExeA
VAILRYLLERPQQLVTKQELMQALWPQAKVLDATLKVSIGEIRKALGDRATKSQFVETVGRKGYRFVAPISLRLSGKAVGDSVSPVVGRASELEQLRNHLELANQGKRQIVFVTGEPGIGKTTLIELFSQSIATDGKVVIALGQCIEQYGAGEAFMPILDALERLCKSPEGSNLIEVLRRCAPSWLLSLPGLVSPEERVEFARQTQGTTLERRLREIAALLEEIAKTQTVVLILEDLHWLDPSSLALISFLARRRETARLIMIGTYRAGEVERLSHPLKTVAAELAMHNFCTNLPLRLLSRGEVGEYLSARFETLMVSDRVLSTVYQRSEGNPLFMVSVVDYLVSRNAIVCDRRSLNLAELGDQTAVPSTIRDLIERQISALSREDQELLETASVAGTTFSVAVVARVLGSARDQVDEQCRAMAKQNQFLQYAGSRLRPSGGFTSRYSFLHSLHQNIIYDRITRAKRSRLHQVIGERTEAAYEGATEKVATELALHFERSGDYDRAVRYLLKAAQEAVRKSAYSEAINHAAIGSSLLKQLEPSTQKAEWGLSLELLLGVSYSAANGYAFAEANEAFSKVRGFSAKVGNQSLLCQSLAGLWSFHFTRGDLATALKLATDLYKLARRGHNPMSLVNGHMGAGIALFYLADFTSAKAHLERACAHYDLESHRREMSSMGWDLGIPSFCYRAKTLWMLGYPEKAMEQARKAVAFAEELSSPFHWGMANSLLSTYYTYRAEPAQALQYATATVEICQEYGFSHWLASGTIFKGWALARHGDLNKGIFLLNDGLDKWMRMGAVMGTSTFLALLAEAQMASNQIPQSLTSIHDGLAISVQNKESYYDAELYRLRGEALLRVTSRKMKKQHSVDGEISLQRAVVIARDQKAKSFELRATLSLCRLWQKSGKEKNAKRMLAKIYGRFTEGFDTPDLKAAKILLDELG